MNTRLTNIVMAFPLCGKSHAARMYPDLFIDLGSSVYHKTGTGRNPAFPGNYVSAACKKAGDNPDKIVLVSWHSAVLEEFLKRCVKPVLVSPPCSSAGKEEWERRYDNRSYNGFDKSVLSQNYICWVDDMYSAAKAHSLTIISLAEKEYITDVIVPHENFSKGTRDEFIQLEPLTNDEDIILYEGLIRSYHDLVAKYKEEDGGRLHTGRTVRFIEKAEIYKKLHDKFRRAIGSAARSRELREARNLN